MDCIYIRTEGKKEGRKEETSVYCIVLYCILLNSNSQHQKGEARDTERYEKYTSTEIRFMR